MGVQVSVDNDGVELVIFKGNLDQFKDNYIILGIAEGPMRSLFL